MAARPRARDIPGGLPPLSAPQWDLLPPVASGVSDGGSSRSQQDMAGPVVSGPVQGATGWPSARSAGWVWGSASSICAALGVLGMALDVPKAWVMFVIAFVVIPLRGSFRRR